MLDLVIQGSGKRLDKFTNKRIEGIIMQTKLWGVLGRILPVVALGLIFMIDLVGYSDVLSKVKVIIGIAFFSSVVYWWWWSTYKIFQLSKHLGSAEKKLHDVVLNLKDIRNSLKD